MLRRAIVNGLYRNLFLWQTVLFVCVGVAAAQNPAGASSSSFDVASIKPSKLEAPMSIRAGLHGTLGATNAPIENLMTFAFGVKPFQIFGGPAWLRSNHYDIEAKVDDKENTTPALFQSRLQALLADRFKLSFHWETKQLPVFALVQTKNGSKLSETKPGECTPPDMNAPLPPPVRGHPAPCGVPLFRKDRLDGFMINMEFLRTILEDRLSRTVLNETDLKGSYTIHLFWVAEDLQVGGNPAAEPATPPAEQGPSLFTALEEQLGLRLESRTGPVKVLVVDHIEPPSEN
jgi:uncharacterized protein (TIGR03435 family)